MNNGIKEMTMKGSCLCGTQLVKQKEGSSDLVLRVATLDDDLGKKTEFRIWASHEVPWLDYNAQIPTYEEWEPGR